tara:strand:- start:1288 stop:1422 length:135 start_codon:yes stop_codon:yes gene_type:complete
MLSLIKTIDYVCWKMSEPIYALLELEKPIHIIEIEKELKKRGKK